MTRKCWTKSLGERGHRIRLYEKYPGGPIMRSVYIDGKEVRKSLAHRDKEKATRQGYELLNALLTNERAGPAESNARAPLGLVSREHRALEQEGADPA